MDKGKLYLFFQALQFVVAMTFFQVDGFAVSLTELNGAYRSSQNRSDLLGVRIDLLRTRDPRLLLSSDLSGTCDQLCSELVESKKKVEFEIQALAVQMREFIREGLEHPSDSEVQQVLSNHLIHLDRLRDAVKKDRFYADTILHLLNENLGKLQKLDRTRSPDDWLRLQIQIVTQRDEYIHYLFQSGLAADASAAERMLAEEGAKLKNSKFKKVRRYPHLKVLPQLGKFGPLGTIGEEIEVAESEDNSSDESDTAFAL